MALGAFNRTSARPRLAAKRRRGESPGAAGVLLRRALVAETGLMLGVLAATAALASYSPPASASGPFSAAAELGPARMEVTVDPARAGPNQVHLYLFDRRDGAQFDRVKELASRAAEPERHASVPLHSSPAQGGPGPLGGPAPDIAPAGDWRARGLGARSIRRIHRQARVLRGAGWPRRSSPGALPPASARSLAGSRGPRPTDHE